MEITVDFPSHLTKADIEQRLAMLRMPAQDLTELYAFASFLHENRSILFDLQTKVSNLAFQGADVHTQLREKADFKATYASINELEQTLTEKIEELRNLLDVIRDADLSRLASTVGELTRELQTLKMRSTKHQSAIDDIRKKL